MKLVYLLSFFWLISQIKKTLFWIYLWQLKEYHLGRFKAHFELESGKKLILNFKNLFKIFLLILFKFRLAFILGFFVYLFEGIFAFWQILKRKLKVPIWTIKTKFLFYFSLFLQIIFIYFLFKKISVISNFFLFLLIFDILTPLFISIIVLSFQPVVFSWRFFYIMKAKMKREKMKNLIAIGITGSYGKSSTKEFLSKILSLKFKVLKTKENQNSEIGIAKCILNDLSKDHEILIAEMAAYNKGGIKLLCKMVKPKIGILTGVNEQHLSTFGSMKNLLSAEGGRELIESLPNDGLMIFNGNNKWCRKIYEETEKPKKISACNLEGNFDLLADEIKVEKEFVSFSVRTNFQKSYKFKVNVLGQHNVENLLLSFLTALELGFDFNEIKKACQKIVPKDGKMELYHGKNEIDLLLSTYSANPNSVLAHLEYLKIWPSKKIIVMPCLIELGKMAKKIHKKIGEKIGEVCDLAIITTKDYFKEIKEGVLRKKLLKENLFLLENENEILKKIKNSVLPKDVILLEGRLPRKLIEQIKSII